MDIQIILILALEASFALYLLFHERLLNSLPALLLSFGLLALAFIFRYYVLDYETLDYQNFLSRWAAFFREHGGFLALKHPVGNYNIPYLYFLALFSYIDIQDLYLIKLLSILFDVLLSWSSLRLCRRFTKSSGRLLACFFSTLFLPTVFLNSAVWAQCDSLYVSLAILGIALSLEDRPIPSMICITLSFGIKLQAVFIMPVYAVLWIYKKFNWKHFFVFPLCYVLLVLPAVLLGRPFLDTITLYASQTGSIGNGLNYNSPSVFAVFTNIQDPNLASTIAIVVAFIYVLNLLAVAWVYRTSLNDRSILAFSLLFAVGIPFLLPHMHERYFYAADILSLILAFSVPLFSPAALLVQFASLLGYYAYLNRRYLLLMNNGAAALVIVLALALIFLLTSLNPEADLSLSRKPKH